MDVNNKGDIFCSSCLDKLRDAYGYCIECPKNTLLCQECLGKGAQFDNHKNNHQTVPMRLDFSLLEVGWTATEELELLDGLLQSGPNDWDNVSKYMGSVRTAKEIKEHYLRVYQNNHQYQINPAFIAHRANSHDPPRFPSSSILYNAFSGYNAARGDFQKDYDNDAERDLSELDAGFILDRIPEWDAEETELGGRLFFAMVDMYNKRLGDRKKRHRIIRRHGLILPQKNFLWLRRFDDSSMQWSTRGGDRLSTTSPGANSQMTKTLIKFSQYLSGYEFDKMFEGLKLEADLKSKLNELYDLRRNGIESFYMASIYKKYSKSREEFLKERRKYMFNPYHLFKYTCNAKAGVLPHLVNQSRRPAPPLEVSKLPGYDKLSTKERELCSVARVVPDSFLEFKNILVAECLKQSGLRLAQARNLIKIDVNKTRKLYDFFIEEGAIYQP